jgi:hypothetical protein
MTLFACSVSLLYRYLLLPTLLYIILTYAACSSLYAQCLPVSMPSCFHNQSPISDKMTTPFFMQTVDQQLLEQSESLLGTQQPTIIETLIGSNIRWGSYGGPIIKFSPVSGTLGTWVGGYGGVVLDGTFFLGGGGWGLTSNIPANQSIAPGQSLGIGYGGIILEYIGSSDKLLHYGVSLLIGAGGASYIFRNFDTFGRNQITLFNRPSSSFFVVEPGGYAEINITRWLRIGASVSYRYANGVRLEGLSSADVGGVAGNVIFKFGSF